MSDEQSGWILADGRLLQVYTYEGHPAFLHRLVAACDQNSDGLASWHPLDYLHVSNLDVLAMSETHEVVRLNHDLIDAVNAEWDYRKDGELETAKDP